MENTLEKSKFVIHTPDQRLRIFISSTLEELASERLAAKKAINNLHLTPVMFELGARPHPPREVYSAYLEQSHIFIGIYGERYGWIIPELKISGLEDEFRLSQKHPRLIYVKRPAPNREVRLRELVDSILNAGVSCKFFSDAGELCDYIENDLALLLTERYEQGGTSSSLKPNQSAIPIPPTPLIGREAEIAAVKNFLQQKEISLVTLTGTGGIGKTRIALEIARQMHKDFSDGVYFVPLASVRDSALVPSTVVQFIFPGELGGQPPLQLLTQLFFEKDVLLVLDNFEQVIGAASFIADLLRACAGLKILVTSREVLRVSSEQEFRVPMLPVPQTSDSSQNMEDLKMQVEKSSSVHLFVQRAKAINPAFELTKENAAAIAEICISLDGLPLAIELAAARIRILTPQAMLPHLGKKLSLLTAGKRDMPERHRTLMATIAWSYLMLLPEEQQLLCKLSVFTGGCTLQSAFSVAGSRQISPGEFPRMAMFLNNPDVKTENFPEATPDFMELMESLDAKNLIYSVEQGGDIRFMMYATIKEYAQQQLESISQKELTEKNHFIYFLKLGEDLWSTLLGNDAYRSFVLLDHDLDNMREALRWGLENDPVRGLRLALALGEYWDTRGMPYEQIWWTNNFLKKLNSGELEISSTVTAIAKIELGRASFRENDHEKTRVFAEEVSLISKQLQNEYLFVDSVMERGMVAIYSGDFSHIKILTEEALAVSRKLNYKLGTINLLQNLAAAANFEGRIADVTGFARGSLVIAEEMGAIRWEEIGYSLLGFSQMSLGDIEASAASFSKALERCKLFMDSVMIVYPLIGKAQVAIALGNTDVAIKLLGAAEKFCERKGTSIVPVVVKQIVSLSQDMVKSQVGGEEYQRLYEIGCRLHLNEAIAIAEE